MVYIPQGAQWYIAEIIEEICIEDDNRNVVHKNLLLIHADSPEAAYARCLEIGSQSESSYLNPDGKNVTSHFRGVSYLNVIHDDLEDGAELLYERRISVGEEEILKWVRPKEELDLFRDRDDAIDCPNYSSKDVLNDAIRLIEQEPKL
ncbi:MAG: DUF4288 domain-containing protein [Acidobacteriia bacterium]|nr:DUF4288 domain-containing protein [Terriglobia bacterium]